MLKADITAPLTRNLAGLLNIDIDTITDAMLRIVVPGGGH